ADVRKQIDEIRHFDFKGEVERAVDPDQSIRKTFTEDPFAAADAAAASAAADGETAVLDEPGPAPEPALATTAPVIAALPDGPAFVPPAVVAATLAPPSFVPPDLLSRRS
ncbi:MAG: hypothetical protein ACREEU_08450, partial [Acetobacteraceae bacterium]